MVTIGEIPVYDALILDELSGMMRISLVDDPAVMSNFQAFDNTKKMLMYAVSDEERRLVRGVVMRADFPIYRRDEMGEYYIIYKASTIRTMAEKYLAESRQNNVNLMHGKDTDVLGVNMVQYFIKGDGVSVAGFDDCADGSLIAEFHITNDEVWEAVKDGTYKGFSLEGYFDLMPMPDKDEEKVEEIIETLDGKFNKHTLKNNRKMSKMKRFYAALQKAFTELGNMTTDKGIITWDGAEDLQVGDSVFIEDEEGNLVPAADGDYTNGDGVKYTVADGKVTEITEPESEAVAVEEAEEVKMGRVNTDKGELIWNTDEDLKEGDEVYQEKEGEFIPAEDGDYTTEDGKVITVAEGKVASISDAEAEVASEPDEEVVSLKAENESLRAENASLKAELEQMKRTPMAKTAHEEVETFASVTKTGNRGLDRLAKAVAEAREFKKLQHK